MQLHKYLVTFYDYKEDREEPLICLGNKKIWHWTGKGLSKEALAFRSANNKQITANKVCSVRPLAP